MWILQSSDGESSRSCSACRPVRSRPWGVAAIADLILDAALVSRIHCRLEAERETLEVVDLESTNGIYVNGERVSRAHLIPGDRLKVGRVELDVGRSD